MNALIVGADKIAGAWTMTGHETRELGGSLMSESEDEDDADLARDRGRAGEGDRDRDLDSEIGVCRVGASLSWDASSSLDASS